MCKNFYILTCTEIEIGDNQQVKPQDAKCNPVGMATVFCLSVLEGEALPAFVPRFS